MKSLRIALIIIFFSLPLFKTFAQINLSQGLVGYYTFSGNANDASGNGNNGTVNGATLTSDRYGNTNSAYQFDGVSNYISLPSAPFLNTNYSYSVWVKVSTLTSVYQLFDIGGSLKELGVAIHNTNGFQVGAYNTNSSISAYVSHTLPVADQWYNITITRDDANLKLYINGSLAGSSPTTGLTQAYLATGNIAYLGIRYNFTEPLNGVLDDVRIYNRALTDCEIKILADDLNNGLAAYYPFSGNGNDASGNGINGTVNGATLTSDRFGNANAAYYFNGTNSHITLPPATLVNTNYSYSVWIKPYDNSSAYTIIGIGNTSGDQTIQLVSPLGIGGGGYNIGSPSSTVVRSGIMPSLNTWYHIVMTRDNSTVSLYVNGILTGSSPTNGTDPYYGPNLQYAEIGMRESAIVQFFNGVIDDVRIYNRALSSCEVSTLANDIPPLSAYAGSDQSICTNSTSLSASTPSIGSGSWSLISGSGTITNSSSATTTVTNLGPGTNVFRWTVTYGSQSVYDDVSIISNGDLNNGLVGYYPFSGNANDASGNGNNGTVNGATLTSDRFGNANSAYQFDGINNYISLPSAPFLNTNYSYSLWVDVSTLTSVYQLFDVGGSLKELGVAIHNTNGFQYGAYNTNSSLSVYVSHTLPKPDVWYHIAITRDDANVKLYINGLLAGSVSTTGQTQAYLATGNIAYLGIRYNFTEPFKGVLDDVRIYSRALSSCEVSDLANDIPPLSANAGADQSICTNNANLSANSPSIGSGAWSLISGSGTISSSNSATTVVSNLGQGTNVFRWTVTYGNQSAYDEVSISNSNLTTANAGSDQIICTSSVTLIGNNPSSGTALWSLVSGTGNISNPNNASSSVSNLSFGSNVFMYTITNNCGSSSDMVTIQVDTYPSIANAGADQNICTSSSDLNANTPLIGTGAWTLISGYGLIDDVNSSTSSVSSLSPGYTTFRWTISNGCGVSYDDVVIASHSTGNLTDGLIGKYDFSGNTNDLSGNFNNGAVYNVSLTTDRYDVSNSAYLFNGTNAYIALPPSSFLVSNYTYVAWVKIDALPSDGSFASIISIGSEGSDQNFGIGNNYFGNSGWSLNSYTGVNKVDVYFSGSVPQTGQWYFVAATRDNQEINLYVNDHWIGALPVNGSAYYGSNTEGANIGSRSHNNFQFFNGSIDDVKIYGRALSICELSDLYHQEATAISKPLNEDKVRIFPNPISEGVLNIETSEVSSMEVLIYNALGTVVYKGQLTNGAAQIEIPFLVKGVYLLKLKTEDAEMNRKLEILN